jgi:lipopolysaccharide/colanic/teichoic acid biosynthesis glycosyltransferase
VRTIVDKENLKLLDAIMKLKKPELQVMYILTDSPEVRDKYKYSSRIYPLKANIRSLLRHDIVDEILFCIASPPKPDIENIILICRQFGVSLLIPEKVKTAGLDIQQHRFISSYGFKVIETSPKNRMSFILKTWWEIAFASFALFMLAPVLVIISIIIKVTSKGPVIFKQLRVGLRGRKFYIYKFRTMVVNAELLKASLENQNEADGPAFKIKDDPRITLIGKILRKTGFDEVPQLYNVVAGQMSLIGPRPLLPSEVSAHEEWQLKRMCIKPGITCTWQIQPERNKIKFEEWMQLDRDYVENWSVKQDIKIFFGTIKSFFAARGV